jgi:DNA-binding beta-propeller fold protein YncE
MKIIVVVFLLASSVKACDTAGTVTTLAGSRSAAFADGTGAAASFSNPGGVAFSPDQTLIAVADRGNGRIRLIVVATGAVSTLDGFFYDPRGMAFSPDQTLIAVAGAASSDNRIRLVVVATGAVSMLAGTRVAALQPLRTGRARLRPSTFHMAWPSLPTKP